MEIWKVGKNGRLYKSPFRTRHSTKPVDHFFDPSFPALAVMIQEELVKKSGKRWIVFSEAEQKEIHNTARIYLNPERGTCSSLFLECVLEPVKKTYREAFLVIYVPDNGPDKIPTPGSRMRLAIEILC